MADAYKCDRCGSFYEPKDEINMFNGVRFEMLVFLNRGGNRTRSFDLCNECKYSFFEFMEEPGYFKQPQGGKK